MKKRPLEGSTSDNVVALAPAVKKARLGKCAVFKFLEMPYDIRSEIFRLISPKDLVHLAKTNKQLREEVMWYRSIWAEAADNSGFPHPMWSMSVPEFAFFLFVFRCSFCRTPTRRPAILTAGVRCCETCLPQRFSVPAQLSALDLGVEVLQSLPHIRKTKYRNLWLHEWVRDDVVYVTSKADQFTAEYARIQSGGPDAVSHFLSQKREEYHSISKQVKAVNDWLHTQRKQRKEILEQSRNQRNTVIVERLRELCWAEELQHEFSMSELLAHPKLKESNELTDRMWHNMKPGLIEAMERITQRRKERDLEVRQKRFETLDKTVLCYIRTHPNDPCTPITADVALNYKPIRDLIEGIPTDIQIYPRQFAHELSDPTFAKFVSDWNNIQIGKILRALEPYALDLHPNNLQLCTSLFKSQCDSLVYSYTGFMNRQCGGGPGHVDSSTPRWCPGPPTADCKLELCLPSIALTKRVCTIYHLSWETMLFHELLAINPFVICRCCSVSMGGHTIARWSTMLDNRHHDQHLEALMPVTEAGKKMLIAIENACGLRELYAIGSVSEMGKRGSFILYRNRPPVHWTQS